MSLWLEPQFHACAVSYLFASEEVVLVFSAILGVVVRELGPWFS